MTRNFLSTSNHRLGKFPGFLRLFEQDCQASFKLKSKNISGTSYHL